MRIAVLCTFVFALAAAAPADAQVAVSMHDGLVTVDASNSTVRQILAEWAKVGQTRIVNGEGMSGGPVTLQLTNVPEEEALGILLRSAAGYLAVPRALAVANASHFDRIVVMPTSAPTNRAIAPPPNNLPQRIQTTPFDQDDDRNPPPAPPLVTLQERLQQAQQQLLQAQPGQAPPPAPVERNAPPPPPPASRPAPFAVPSPAAPGGVSMPGVIVPAPQPGQPPPASPQG